MRGSWSTICAPAPNRTSLLSSPGRREAASPGDPGWQCSALLSEMARPAMTGKPKRLAWHQRPVVQVEDHRSVVVLAGLGWKSRTRFVIGRDRAQPQRADVAAAGSVGASEQLRPGT